MRHSLNASLYEFRLSELMLEVTSFLVVLYLSLSMKPILDILKISKIWAYACSNFSNIYFYVFSKYISLLSKISINTFNLSMYEIVWNSIESNPIQFYFVILLEFFWTQLFSWYFMMHGKKMHTYIYINIYIYINNTRNP